MSKTSTVIETSDALMDQSASPDLSDLVISPPDSHYSEVACTAIGRTIAAALREHPRVMSQLTDPTSD